MSNPLRKARTVPEIMAAMAGALGADLLTAAEIADCLHACPPESHAEARGRLATLYGDYENRWAWFAVRTAGKLNICSGPIVGRLPGAVSVSVAGTPEFVALGPDLEETHQRWGKMHDGERPKHPFAPIYEAASRIVGRPPSRRHLHISATLPEGRGAPHRPLARVPAIIDLGLTAIEVDGAPFATPVPGGVVMRQNFRAPIPAQGELWPAPRTLAGETADPVLRMAADMALTGDERSTLRGDLISIGRFVYAVSGPVRLSQSLGAAFLGGKDTEANRRRWNSALLALRWATMTVNERTGEWRDLAVVTAHGNGDYTVGPPAWWLDPAGAYLRHRLTSGLLRPVLIREASRGTGEGYWGAVARTVDGLEASLSYGPSAGKGRGGRTPDLLRPADGRKAGPGPEVFLSWRAVLRTSGEHVAPNAAPKDKHGRTYRRRVGYLESAGYMLDNGRDAPAGDSIEIVRVQRGGKGRGGGLIVRASARYTEAIRRSQQHGERTLIPASSVFPGMVADMAGNGGKPDE